MSGTREERARELFFAAIDVRAERRDEFLNERCGGDGRLRAEVESLLAHDERAGKFMESTRTVALNPEPSGAGMEGKRIGAFTIRRLIASGGMGNVFEAQQESPRRPVALKLMRGGIASSSALRRFQFEAQLLARLRHPAIAQIYEAGSHDDGSGGVPFFAMEYIPRAAPITQHARDNGLTTRQRLDLFSQVCDAVHHGHQKGIIHRDLKPSNILVDSSGRPKIIDFGVARATDSDLAVTTLQTSVGQLIGTLQYMSPEQCAADPHDLDTRSDVYALGVVLYELLLGQVPYDVSRVQIAEAARLIRDHAAPRPSSLDRKLRGDVETIVLKAIEKDRSRRYQSAAELAADIRRYLGNEPIVARPASAFYQLGKFARRHRGLAGGVAAAFAVLVVALVVVSELAVRINRESETTARTNEFLESLLLTTDFLEAGKDPIAPEQIGINVRLVDVLGEGLDRLDDDPTLITDRALEATLRYRGGMGLLAKGDLVESRKQLERALTMRRQIHGDEQPETLECKVGLATTLNFFFDQRPRAEQLAREAVDGYLAMPEPPDERALRAMFSLAVILRNEGKYPEAVEVGEQMVGILESSEDPIDFAGFGAKALIGSALCKANRPDEAERWIREAEDELEAETGGVHTVRAVLDRARALLAARRGQWDEAKEILDSAHEADIEYSGAKTVFGSDSLKTMAMIETWRGEYAEAARIKRQVVDNYVTTVGMYNTATAQQINMLAYWLFRAGQDDEAEAEYRRWCEIAERVTMPARYQATVRRWFGHVLYFQNKRDEALQQVVTARRLMTEEGGADDPFTLFLSDLHAWHLWDQGRFAEAEPIARETVAGFRRIRKVSNLAMVNALDTLACILRDLGGAEEALVLFEEMEAACANPELDIVPPNSDFVLDHAECLTRLRRYEEAEAKLLAIEERTARVIAAVVALYDTWRKPDKAAEWRSRLTGRGDSEAGSAQSDSGEE
jgi:tetratricopeptide (TPR) repeat protein